MRPSAGLVAAFALAGCATAAAPLSPAAPAPKRLTVERIFSDPDLSGSLAHGLTWLPDGSGYVFIGHEDPQVSTSRRCVRKVDAATGQESVWIDADAFAKALTHAADGRRRPNGRGGFEAFSIIPGGERLLIQSEGDLWRYEVRAGDARRLTETPQEERDAAASPDGSRIAFVRGFDLWSMDTMTGQSVRLTHGGTEERTHGLSDWVYDEELGVGTGFWWSPDSSRIAYLDIDETPVPRIPIVDFRPTHPTVEWQRYPKAGDPNPVVSLFVVPAQGGGSVAIDLPGAKAGYVARVDWTPDGSALLVQVLDRAQQHLTLWRCDPATGASAPVFEETSAAWIDVHRDLRVLHDGRLLWKSARTGFDHLWTFDPAAKSWTQVTRGEWNVDSVEGLDEAAGVVWFGASAENPRETHLWRIRLDGTGMQKLTSDAGCHSISMAPGNGAFLDTWSDAAHPPRRELYRADGSLVAHVEKNPCEELAAFPASTTEFVEFGTVDGEVLQGKWIRPADFDPARRYPVLLAVYGGPLSRTVSNSWGGRTELWHRCLADAGILVFAMDNRAAAPHGLGVASAIRGRLGKVELDDELAAVGYLRSQDFVDGHRIAIWGWSYGGTMAAYSILNAPAVFRAAVAVAPVTDWRNYDTIYTERYMGLPSENAAGYDASSCVKAAPKLAGRLLLMHGTSDDNVHVQNTMQLADALVRAGRPFRLAAYPGKHHGIEGAAEHRHVFRTMTDFLLDALAAGGRPPDSQLR